jgi:Mg-chelatase subunit ChlD
MKLSEVATTNFGGGAQIAVRNTALQGNGFKKLTDTYDEHAKLVFIFDVSGSMDCRIAKSYTDGWTWTADQLAAIRNRVIAAISNINANGLMNSLGVPTTSISEEDEKLAQLADPQRGDRGQLSLSTCTDEELKERVVRATLMDHFGIEVNWSRHGSASAPTRLECVKKLARQELEKRFAKYPQSQVSMVRFGSFAESLFNDGTAVDLWPVLDNLSIGCGGGTDILAGIRKGMDTCRKAPSQVGVHHFIVVSDGEDGEADRTIGSWVPTLKASGICLDYIHIGDSGVNTGLEAACKALGGECVVVNSIKDLEAKFIEAVGRLMLPPPASM